jgi:hypothetical protein
MRLLGEVKRASTFWRSLAVLVLLAGVALNYGTSLAQQGAREQPPPADRATVTAIIDSVTAALNEIYVFPKVAADMEKHVRDRLKKKAYDNIGNLADFTDTLTEDLLSVSHDRHLWVRWVPHAAYDRFKEDSLTDADIQERIKRAAYENFGFEKVEHLAGNIGYVDFREFQDASIGGATAVAAMNFLSNCDAIIFDLRQNGGGNPSMIQLISSYFFEEPVHLNSFYIRAQDTIEQFWTQAYVQGPKMTDVDLYVLTSSYTFSGAEEFTYNMKNLKRATIIGETTGGGAHPVNRHLFANLGVAVSLPYGRAINPITGTNWEGVGVEPDIKVPQEEALDVARIEAMKKLAAKATDENIKASLEWTIPVLEAYRNPATLDPALMASYAGKYGPRTITYENGELYYQREGRPKYKMIPMSQDTFVFKELDYFRLKVVKDENGNITHLEGQYAGGQTDTSPRDKS